jgi:predicted alpha/beta superfamily hydrolase
VTRLLALLLMLVGLSAAQAQGQGRFDEMQMTKSATMPQTGVTIWLPPGYDAGKQRYPVVYMHDAQNLFFTERSNFNKVWAADKSALRLIAAKKLSPFIIVGINQPGEARYAQYFPQALREAASPELRAKIDSMTKQPLYGDAYLRWLTGTLKPMIDIAYRTKKDRDHTAIAGSSMGGLISCYAFTRYPKVFGRAACVSTHWPMGNPEETAVHKDEIVKLWADEFVRGLGEPNDRRLWMDHGDQTLDAYYPPYQAAITPKIAARGWIEGKDFAARAYPGTPHEENAWAARMDDIFGWMLTGW